VPSSSRQPPDLPEIGKPEAYYSKLIQDGEKKGDINAHEAAKVGQYVTLAMNPNLKWEDKLRYFRHALRRHCRPPGDSDEELVAYYDRLGDLVRRHCGYEALRMVSAEDDLYAARRALGQPAEDLEEEAEQFFAQFFPPGDCPEWFNPEDWNQLKLIRDQWM
jgi:hypothetical protein